MTSVCWLFAIVVHLSHVPWGGRLFFKNFNSPWQLLTNFVSFPVLRRSLRLQSSLKIFWPTYPTHYKGPALSFRSTFNDISENIILSVSPSFKFLAHISAEMSDSICEKRHEKSYQFWNYISCSFLLNSVDCIITPFKFFNTYGFLNISFFDLIVKQLCFKIVTLWLFPIHSLVFSPFIYLILYNRYKNKSPFDTI